MPLDPQTLSLDRLRELIAPWGFVSIGADLPDHPGQSHLLVALREHPAETHYDPESAACWHSIAGHGQRWAIGYQEAPFPARPFAWGEIRIIDRKRVTNEWASFGGTLELVALDATTKLAIFRSDAPILRAGGHSQDLDALADAALAYFARLRPHLANDSPIETAFAAAAPLAVQVAFLEFALKRPASDLEMRLIRGERNRIRTAAPAAYADGFALYQAVEL